MTCTLDVVAHRIEVPVDVAQHLADVRIDGYLGLAKRRAFRRLALWMMQQGKTLRMTGASTDRERRSHQSDRTMQICMTARTGLALAIHYDVGDAHPDLGSSRYYVIHEYIRRRKCVYKVYAW